MATSAQRQRMFRQRKADQDLVEVRGIFAPPEHHAAIKAGAKLISLDECRRNVLRQISDDIKALTPQTPETCT